MTLTATCPRCARQVTGPDEAAGKSGRCPACQGRVAFPAPEPAGPPVDDEGRRVYTGGELLSSIRSGVWLTAWLLIALVVLQVLAFCMALIQALSTAGRRSAF
jgi:hypothetical protein